MMILAKNILCTIKGKMEEGELDPIVKEASETVSLSPTMVKTISKNADQVDSFSSELTLMMKRLNEGEGSAGELFKNKTYSRILVICLLRF
jgi:hypothetical protein